MKFIKIMMFVGVMAAGSVALTATSTQNVVTAKVNGMVCAFCSNSLEKKFGKQKAVSSVDVNLDSKLITIMFKKGKMLSEKKIRKIIKKSGFSVVSVDMGTFKTDEK